jgi:phage-related protein/uncharacterized coiled-coil DUF342 family protein
MAGSFGGSVKLTGESEYTKALKTITSNLTVMASEMKLVSSQYSANDKSVQAITSKNNVLNKEIDEGNKKISTYRKALEDFNKQQDNNATSMMEMMTNLEKEKAKLEELKNSTTASSKEIEAQEKVVADLSTELAKSEAQYEKNKLTINKYQQQLNLAETEVNNLTSELEENKSQLNNNKSAYTILTETIDKQKDKLNELKEQYASAVLEQGKSSNEAKELKGEIKTLSNELKDNESKLKESTSAVDKFTSAEDSAGSSTLKLGDLIKANLTSEAIIAGVKGLASAMTSMVGGLVNLGKEAIQSYADYEQLVGGVETLFKDSAGIVEEYASNAYKTAGLSANDYMETVTSFSASLLQSLNNDTAKSAEVADMAITDMSDNANKMGTDMSMIQSAYQGFAKQNYTMLDNLKLGYGGTKTEMERLLADATKISGVEYDISSLNDVYQAIHVIQGELGITGTTAKEASTTISGSVNSMKSAWTNLVTGIADDNADFDNLISNFVDSIMTMADNILPRISIALDGIVNLILGLADTMLPKILEMGVQLIQNLISGITGNIGSLMTGINQIINTILNALITMLPQIIQAGIQVIVSLIQGIASSLPTLIPQIIECVTLIVETLLDNIDLIIDAGIQLLIGLAEGLIESLPNLIDKIPVIIDKLIQAITNNLPKIIEMGIELIIQLAVGIVKAIPNLVAAVPKLIISLVTGIANYYSQMISKGKELLGKIKDGIVEGISKIPEVGKNLVQGLWNGINDAKDWVLNKIKGFGQSILNGIKSFFGIHSPSTVFKDQIGSNLALGIGEGFTEEMDNVSDLMENSIPTDFDVGVNTNYSSLDTENNTYSKDILVSAFKEALNGMSFKVFDEIFGELVIDEVEKVVYS